MEKEAVALEAVVDNLLKSHEKIDNKIKRGRAADWKMTTLLEQLDSISIDSSYIDLRMRKKDIITKLNNMGDFTLSLTEQVIYMYSHVLLIHVI